MEHVMRRHWAAPGRDLQHHFTSSTSAHSGTHCEPIRRKRTQAGLTLIEMVIAIGVLTIGLTGLIGALFGSVAHHQYAESQTVATNHGRDLLEVLLSADETGEGAAVGMIELWAAIQGGNGLGPQATLTNEVFQVSFSDPLTPGTLLTQADMVNRWRPILVRVTVSWVEGQRPVQLQFQALVNPDQG